MAYGLGGPWATYGTFTAKEADAGAGFLPRLTLMGAGSLLFWLWISR